MPDDDKQIQGSVVINNISDAAAFAIAQRLLDEVQHARRVNVMAEAALGKYLDSTGYNNNEGAKIVGQIKAESDKYMLDLLSSISPPKTDSSDTIKQLQETIRVLQGMVDKKTTINDL